jgi:hypothetical protein
MSLSVPVLALLVSNMLERPEMFAPHWSAVDSATIVFLTCKALRQLRSAWFLSSAVLDTCKNATKQTSLLVYLALKRQRTLSVNANTSFFAASVRAHLADRNAIAISLTLLTDGLRNFLRVSGAWLRQPKNRAHCFKLGIANATNAMSVVELQSINSLSYGSASVRMFVPTKHVLWPNESNFSVSMSDQLYFELFKAMQRWLALPANDADDLRHSLVFILGRQTESALTFFEVFEKQSYARISISSQKE